MQEPVKKTAPRKPRAAASTPPARSAAKPRAASAKPRVASAKPPAATAKASAATARPRVAAGKGTKSTLAQGFEMNHDVIAAHAYDLFERSGHSHGRDVEFWLEAERQVSLRRKT